MELYSWTSDFLDRTFFIVASSKETAGKLIISYIKLYFPDTDEWMNEWCGADIKTYATNMVFEERDLL